MQPSRAPLNIASFLDRNYHLQSAASMIRHDAGWTPNNYTN